MGGEGRWPSLPPRQGIVQVSSTQIRCAFSRSATQQHLSSQMTLLASDSPYQPQSARGGSSRTKRTGGRVGLQAAYVPTQVVGRSPGRVHRHELPRVVPPRAAELRARHELNSSEAQRRHVLQRRRRRREAALGREASHVKLREKKHTHHTVVYVSQLKHSAHNNSDDSNHLDQLPLRVALS